MEATFWQNLVAIGLVVSEEMLLTDGRTDAGTDGRPAGRQTPGHRISSSGLWPVELNKLGKH